MLLMDGSLIQTYEGIFVGPGIRYIPEHNITGNETWFSGGTYHLLGLIAVLPGGSLKIEPGVTVKLQGGGQLNVFGTLDAKDSTFTSADSDNPWGGIHLANASRLDGCIIEHVAAYRVIYVVNGENGSPTITNCTIRDSEASEGIEITNGFPTVTNTTVSGMTNNGILVHSDSSPTLTGCTLTDNKNGIYVQYSTNSPAIWGNTYSNNRDSDLVAYGAIFGSVSFGETGGSVYIPSYLSVVEGGKLSIAPGSTIRFGSDVYLSVSGTLNARDVNFTWIDGENQWEGIYFSHGSSASRLDRCTVEHAKGYQNAVSKPAIHISSSSPTITGCTIRNSVAPVGIEISGGSPMITDTTVSGMTNSGIVVGFTASPTITGCILNENKYGISVDYSSINNPVFSGNTFSNNSEADLNASGIISNAVNWSETDGIVYFISSFFEVAQGASLFISPGSTIKFPGDGQLQILGTLNARDVTFTWADGENQWQGIRFSDSDSSSSRLEGCIIEHAMGYFNGSYGIIYLENSSPTITGCMIRDSVASIGIMMSNGSPMITDTTVRGMSSSGIRVGNDSSPTVTDCTLNNNYYGVYIASSGNGTYQNNSIAGNTSYGIYQSGTTIVNATNNYWGDSTGPLDASDDRDSGGWYNPDGLGDRVSNRVEYFPWIGNADDMDNDNIPDDWEWAIVNANPNDSIEHPLDVLPFNDFDGDGFSNLREFLALSDPVLIQSIPLCWSDFSTDGDVDGMELNTFYLEFGINDCSDANPCSCDLDGDGLVSTTDLLFFSEDFGRTDCE